MQSPWTMQRDMKVPRKKPSLTKSEKMTKRYDNVDIRLHQARSLANRTRTAVSPRYCAHPGQLFRPCYASSVWHNRQYRGIYNVRQITRSRAEDMPNKIESTNDFSVQLNCFQSLHRLHPRQILVRSTRI